MINTKNKWIFLPSIFLHSFSAVFFFYSISFLHSFSAILFSVEIGLVSLVSGSYVLFIILFVFCSIWFLCIDYYP